MFLKRLFQLNKNNLRSQFFQLVRLTIDQRGSTELGAKGRYLRKPKYLKKRTKTIDGKYLSPFMSSGKNIQDIIFLFYSKMRSFFKQKKISNVPEIPKMLPQFDAIRSVKNHHFTWVCYFISIFIFISPYLLSSSLSIPLLYFSFFNNSWDMQLVMFNFMVNIF